MPHIHAPGLVLRLDAQTLADQGAHFAGAGDEELLSQQYYVCVAANPKDALWMPLFAGPGPGRKGITASAKSGHVQWTKHSSFYRPGTLFRVPHKATQQAAEAASDRSTPKTANRIALDQMPPSTEWPPGDAFRPMRDTVVIR